MRHFIYRKPCWDDNIKNLKFVMMQPFGVAAHFKENIPCVAIKLVKTEKAKNVLNLELYCEKTNRNSSNATAKNGNIIELAQFFYFRRSLYKSIHEVLSKNREEFEKISNHFFVEDLIKLFSASNYNKKSINFTISLANEKEIFSKKKIGKCNEINLGKMIFYSKRKTGNKEEIPKYLSNIWLNRKNQLAIETSFIDYKYLHERIFDALNDEEFIKFQNRINDWAEAIINKANFGIAIYERIKNRIFVENI